MRHFRCPDDGQQEVDGADADLAYGLAAGRQWRREIAGRRQIVETDDRKVLRYADSQVPARGENAQRHWSLKQNAAVGAGAWPNSFFAAAWPDSTEKSPGAIVSRRRRPRALAADAHDQRDVLLAHALRTMPVSQPPPGFAVETVRLVQASPAHGRGDARLERVLLNLLFAAMAVSAVAVAAIRGDQWWALAERTIGADALQWALAGVACIAMSWSLGRWRRRPAGDGVPAS